MVERTDKKPTAERDIGRAERARQVEAAYRLGPEVMSDRQQACVWHREAAPDVGFVLLRCSACDAAFPAAAGRLFEREGAVRPEDLGDRLNQLVEEDAGADFKAPCPTCGHTDSPSAVWQVQLLTYSYRKEADLVSARGIEAGRPSRAVHYFVRHGDGTVTALRGNRAELNPFLTESAFRAALGEADFSGEGRYPPSLRSCLQLDPDFPPAIELQAQIRLSAGRLEEAAAGFRRVIELDDTRRFSWHGLGLCLQEMYRKNPKRNGNRVLTQAGECLLMALALEDTPAIRRSLGGFFAMAGQHAGARPHLEAALAADPDHASTNYNLAVVHLAEGDPDSALPLLDLAVKSLPRDPDARRRRAECLLSLGRLDEAGEELQRAYDLAPQDRRIRDLSKKLASARNSSDSAPDSDPGPAPDDA